MVSGCVTVADTRVKIDITHVEVVVIHIAVHRGFPAFEAFLDDGGFLHHGGETVVIGNKSYELDIMNSEVLSAKPSDIGRLRSVIMPNGPTRI